MDLAGFTSFICTKIGMSDASSLAACATYVQRRYQMLYDRYPWRDSLTTISANSTALQTSIALPVGLDRVISIRYGGDHFLDPIDDTFLIEADPTIFERTGIPQYYREYTDTADDSKKIQFYPTPSIDGAMLIVGKRTAPPLVNGSDVPILRNIDNVLIAYAHGDMMEKGRQYLKAKEKFAEGALLYAEAEALEKQQTNVPRRTKKLTVNGNSLAEMTDAVCARIGDYMPDTQILIKEFLRRCYQEVYDLALWPETLVPVRANSDGSQVILPDYIDRVVAVRAQGKNYEIYNEDISAYFGITPQIFEQTTGAALAYSLLTPIAVATLPPIQERLAFVSNDPMDNATVFVRGESSGQIYEESVQLNGLAPVYTLRAYDVPLTVSKPTTHGEITVSGAFTNVTLQTLSAIQTERKHMRLWIQPTNTTEHNCLILGKRRISNLSADSDTPMLRSVHNILINAAAGDAMAKLGNAQAAADFRAKADAATKTLIDLETNQQSHVSRIIPYVDSYSDAIGYGDDWLVSKAALL